MKWLEFHRIHYCFRLSPALLAWMGLVGALPVSTQAKLLPPAPLEQKPLSTRHSTPAEPSTNQLDCDCQYFVTEHSTIPLSFDLTQLRDKLSTPKGHSLAGSSEMYDQHRSRILHDPNIPEKCREWVAQKRGHGTRPTQLAIRWGRTLPGDSRTYLGDERLIGRSLADKLNDLRRRWSRIQPICSSGAMTSEDYARCIRGGARPDYAHFIKEILNGSVTDLTQRANINRSPFLESPYNDRDSRIIRAFAALTQSQDFEILLKQIPSLTASLSNEEFLDLVALFGSQALSQYDKQRANPGSIASQGIVAESKILESLRANMANQAFSHDENLNLTTYAGVCRDISVFQARMFEARGFKNTRILSYRAQTSGHTVVLTEDPNRPGQQIRLNYGRVRIRAGRDGAESLYQGQSGGISDLTSEYKIHDANGKHLGTINSEMGKLLIEASGFDLRDYDSVSRTQGNLQSIRQRFEVTDKVQTHAQFFTGRDANDSDYIGAGVTGAWSGKTNSRFSYPGKLALTLAHRADEINAHRGANEDFAIGYIQWQQSAQHEPISLNQQNQLKLKSTFQGFAHASQLITMTTEQGQRHFLSDHPMVAGIGSGGRVNTRIDVSLESQLTSTLESQVGIGAQAEIGKYDIRENMSVPSNWKLTPTDLYLKGRLEKRWKDGSRGYLQGILSHNALSTRGDLEAGWVTQKSLIALGASGNLDFLYPDQSTENESSLDRFRLHSRYRLTDHFDLGAELEYTDVTHPIPALSGTTPVDLDYWNGTLFLGGSF